MDHEISGSSDFARRLSSWTDRDAAAFELAVVLGLIPKGWSFQLEAKHLFWSANPLGDALYSFLESLTKAGILEQDEDDRLRWVGPKPA